MKEVKYKCDICKEEKPRKIGGDVSTHDIFEFYWTWRKDLGRNSFEIKPLSAQDTCDRHICRSCILDIIQTAPAGITLPNTDNNYFEYERDRRTI